MKTETIITTKIITIIITTIAITIITKKTTIDSYIKNKALCILLYIEFYSFYNSLILFNLNWLIFTISLKSTFPSPFTSAAKEYISSNFSLFSLA